MYAFDYTRPATLDEASAALKATPGAKLLAGGQTLIPTLKFRLANPEMVIDLTRVASLRGISRQGGSFVIGAMTTHAALAESAEVRAAMPALARLAEGIGDPHVRNRGTVGGAIANNDPAADYPAAILALGATITTNKRSIAADDYFKGLFTTVLADDEILTAVSFPVPQSFGYGKFANPASRYALVGVAVARSSAGPRVAVTGAGSSGVFRWTAAEKALAADFSASAIGSLEPDAAGLMSDLHAAADYRAHLVNVMAKRALEASIG